MKQTFVTSDQHFSHLGILKHEEKRYQKFDSVEEMNDYLISIWNSVIHQGDKVYHLGDFYLGNDVEEFKNILSRLNGNIVFIRGNHDNRKFSNLLKNMGYDVHDVGLKIKFNKVNFIMSHYPMNVDPYPYSDELNTVNIHGHIHEESDFGLRNYNVCIDSISHRYFKYGEPVPLDTIVYLVKEHRRLL